MKVLNLFIVALVSISAQANECPVTNSAMITNTSYLMEGGKLVEGEYIGVLVHEGYLKQTFIIPPAYEAISGRLKFLSDEWPEWFGSRFNDTYSAMLAVSLQKQRLAAGNVNSSSWLASSTEFNGETPPIDYLADLNGLANQQATITYEVKNAGDSRVDSALVIEPVNVVRTDEFVHAGAGYINGGAKIQGQFGQVVKLNFTNKNVVGAILQVENKVQGLKQGAIVLPGQTATFAFQSGGVEPVYWSFDVSTLSDAMLVDYTIDSTWTNGMPLNPCF